MDDRLAVQIDDRLQRLLYQFRYPRAGYIAMVAAVAIYTLE